MAKTGGGVRTAGQQAPTRAGTGRDADQEALATWMKKNNIAGPYWTSSQAQTDFEFESFMAPAAFVRRKADNVRGSLTWADAQAIPALKKEGIYARLYYGFIPS